MYQIYAIRCKETGKIYIGCTKNPVHIRIQQHFKELENHEKFKYTYIGKNKTTREPSEWQKDYDKFGRDAFEFYILESVIEERAKDKEAQWIEEYKSWDERYGYNIRRGINIRNEYTIQAGLPPKLFK